MGAPLPKYVSFIEHEMTLCLRWWRYDLGEGRSLFGLYSKEHFESRISVMLEWKEREIKWAYNISYQSKITNF